ncbi:MAG: S-methyl-5'-thioadenosine phosphorylase [Akkermansiaceae bacterium]
MTASIGIIGGSGLYEIEGFEQTEERTVETPFGAPSDALIGGTIAGRQVWFLPRHARGHKLLPHEINHRANIWAMRSLGVRWLICVTAVGSLKQEYAPRHIVLPDQYFDRTSRREHHTFFGNGIIAHIGFGQPVSCELRSIMHRACVEENCTVHNGGTYVNMDGPAFSTKAESEANRQLGFDVIGMTNLPEAKLAREAEIALATLCMVTDYDCWHESEEDVSVDTVIGHLTANSATAKKLLTRIIPDIPSEPTWPEHDALAPALMTPKEHWPKETVEKLKPLLGKYS